MSGTPDFLHQSIIDQLSEPKVIVEANESAYRILLVNKAFGDFTGVKQAQFRGLSFPVIFSAYNPGISAKTTLAEGLKKALAEAISVEIPYSRYEIPLSQIPAPHWWKAEIAPIADGNGKVIYLAFTVKVNIFARAQAEKATVQWQESEAAILIRQKELIGEWQDTKDKLSQSQPDSDVSGKDLSQADFRPKDSDTALAQSAIYLRDAGVALLQSDSDLAAAREEMREQGVRLSDMTENEYRLNRLVTTTPIGLTILKGNEMIIEIANDAILRIWGRTLPDVLNQPLLNVFPELEDQPFPKLIKQVLSTGISFSMPDEPAIIILPDGTPKKIYVDFSYDALLNKEGTPDAVLVSVNDITEVIEANILVQGQRDELEAMNEEMSATNEEIHAINEELKASNEEIRSTNEELYAAQAAMQVLHEELEETYDQLNIALESGRLGSYNLDLLSGNMSCTAQCKANYGLPPEAIFNFPDLMQVIIPEYRNYVSEKVKAAIATDTMYQAEYQVRWPDGSVHWVIVSGKPVYNEERVAVRMNGITREITEQKADEQRKNDFIGMVSHELKTPLTSMYGYLQILQDNALDSNDDKAMSVAERAMKQINKMTAMINGFLNVSRLESGKIQIDNTRFDMALLMKEAEEESISLFKTHQLIFEPVKEMFVFADRDKIGQVINNLISNAVKYSPPRSLIQVACITINGNARVSVADHGIGVQPEDKKKLFERYYRVKDAATQSVSGFGIGLYLCAEIIKRHNGNIWLESEPGQGSTFYFTLPVVGNRR